LQDPLARSTLLPISLITAQTEPQKIGGGGGGGLPDHQENTVLVGGNILAERGIELLSSSQENIVLEDRHYYPGTSNVVSGNLTTTVVGVDPEESNVCTGNLNAREVRWEEIALVADVVTDTGWVRGSIGLSLRLIHQNTGSNAINKLGGAGLDS
jgi:hypothetical protein